MADHQPSSRAEQVDLESKLAFLRRPDVYPDRPSRVEVIETHRSWVFLTGTYAYKLKKPIRYNAVDVTTLQARRANCAEEVRLNRRLAANVYLDVVPLTLDPDGNLALNGVGEPVDWLVQMRQLPAERMLDHMVQHHTLQAADVRRAAVVLARFYQRSTPEPISADQYRQQFEREIQINARDLAPVVYGLPAELLRDTRDAQLRVLACHAHLFDQRVAAGRIVEGHGDLRPQHICLEPNPVIFDCLEFDRQLRIVDAVDELSFLAMECERIGGCWVGPILFDVYQQVTGDHPPVPLVHFYKAFRAALWARLAVWRARELAIPSRAKWLARANDYLRLADRYSRLLP